MLKHIAGFVIFSFIVGTSVVIGNLFTPIPSTSAVQVADSGDRIYKKKRKRRCPGKRPHPPADSADLELPAVLIKRVTFFERIGQLQTELHVNIVEGSDATPVDVALHFYVSDKYGTRYLATEFVTVGPEIPKSEDASETLRLSFGWLNRLTSHENLFVMAEVAGDRESYQKLPPAFEPLKATAITLGGSGIGSGNSRF